MRVHKGKPNYKHNPAQTMQMSILKRSWKAFPKSQGTFCFFKVLTKKVALYTLINLFQNAFLQTVVSKSVFIYTLQVSIKQDNWPQDWNRNKLRLDFDGINTINWSFFFSDQTLYKWRKTIWPNLPSEKNESLSSPFSFGPLLLLALYPYALQICTLAYIYFTTLLI